MTTKKSKNFKRINEIKLAIANIGDFRSGSLSEQYNVCGKSGCRCKDKNNPQKHGPYYQIGYYKNKKHTTLFVKKEHINKIKEEIKNYQRLQELIKEWVRLSTEESNDRLSV